MVRGDEITFAEFVTLIDCPRGDAGLLTRKAGEALRAAEVIVYQGNVSWVAAGREPGRSILADQITMDELAKVMADLVSRHGRVAWAGDLNRWFAEGGGAVVGRLYASGISCRIVSGVSTFQSSAVRVGIPLTRRNANESFWVPTGPLHPPDVMLVARSTATAIIPLETPDLDTAIEIFQAVRQKTEPVAIILEDGDPRDTPILGTLHSLRTSFQQLRQGFLVIGKVSEYAKYRGMAPGSAIQ